ncbi:MAG: hypothetical protein EBR30_05210 [Cytophagia bacterium]|nr:hypothetical protein [Cytophagia bacterium]
MKYHSIDRSKFPIVIVKINPIDPNDEQFDEYIKEVTQVMLEMEGGILIHILTESKFLPTEKRVKIGNLFKDNADLFKNSLAGLGYVNSAFIPLTILKGIFLVNKPPVPYTVVSTLEDALKWADQRLKEQTLKA